MELEIYGKQYSFSIINNANILAKALDIYQFNIIQVPPKYTYTHQIFISMSQNKEEMFYNKCLD